jgi:hypothetical protein
MEERSTVAVALGQEFALDQRVPAEPSGVLDRWDHQVSLALLREERAYQEEAAAACAQTDCLLAARSEAATALVPLATGQEFERWDRLLDRALDRVSAVPNMATIQGRREPTDRDDGIHRDDAAD